MYSCPRQTCYQQSLCRHQTNDNSTPQNTGPGNSVGIATNYGIEGPGIESRWWRDFPRVQTGPGAHPASCTMCLPEVKYGRGVSLTTHSLLAPRSWNSRGIPLPTLWATTRPVTGLLYLYLYLYLYPIEQEAVFTAKYLAGTKTSGCI